MFLNSLGQLLIGVLIFTSFVNCEVELDITQASVHGTPMNQLVCNKDTVIDFRFSPFTKLKNCDSNTSACTTVKYSSYFIVISISLSYVIFRYGRKLN